MSDSTSSTDETMPPDPARPSDDAVRNQVDQMVMGNNSSVRRAADGTTQVNSTSAMSSSGDVTPPPSLDDLTSQITGHQTRAAQLREQLATVDFNRDGKVTGHRFTGPARAALEAQLAQCAAEVEYTVNLIATTSAARAAWNAQKEAEATNGAPSADPMVDAAKRERAIQELADMPGPEGRPVGRLAAAKEYDAAQLRQRADRLARG